MPRCHLLHLLHLLLHELDYSRLLIGRVSVFHEQTLDGRSQLCAHVVTHGPVGAHVTAHGQTLSKYQHCCGSGVAYVATQHFGAPI